MNVVIQCFPHAGTHGPYGSRNYKTQIPSLISSHTLELGTRRTHASDKRYCQKLEEEVLYQAVNFQNSVLAKIPEFLT